MALIFASSITLVIQSPLDDPSKTKAKILSRIDLSMTALFCCEMFLKVCEREGLTTSKIQNVLHTFTGVMAIGVCQTHCTAITMTVGIDK